MAKCKGCGKFMSPRDGATHTCLCASTYHKACLGIPDETILSASWRCPECKNKIPKKGNVATPVKSIEFSTVSPPLTTTGADKDTGASPSREQTSSPEPMSTLDTQKMHQASQSPQNVDLGLEFRLLRDEILREVKLEFKGLRQELADLRNLISNSNERIDSLEERICALEKKKEPDSSCKIGELEQTVANLRREINDREQEILLSDVEISNLPEAARENPVQTVLILATKLGVTLKQEDVIFAERVGRTADASGEAKRSRR